MSGHCAVQGARTSIGEGRKEGGTPQALRADLLQFVRCSVLSVHQYAHCKHGIARQGSVLPVSKRKHALSGTHSPCAIHTHSRTIAQATLSLVFSLSLSCYAVYCLQSTLFSLFSFLFFLLARHSHSLLARHSQALPFSVAPRQVINLSMPLTHIMSLCLCHPSLRSVCCIPPCSPTCLAVLPLCSLSWRPGAPCATHCRGV